MSWSEVMLAVRSPQDISRLEADKVARITLALGAQLTLFQCVFDGGATDAEPFATVRAQEAIHRLAVGAQRNLEATAGRFRARGLRVRASVRWDYPFYEGIVRQVLRHQPRLLIIRSRRRAHTERLLLSHTDWKLIETCPCPLLLLKTRRPYVQPLIVAAVDPGHAHDKPAALDEQILESAGLLRDALSGKLAVFHARTPWDEAARLDPQLRDLPEYRDEEFHEAYLARVEARVRALAARHAIERGQVHVEEAHAGEAIVRFARRHRADIVVMGAVSRSRLRHALIGHTAEQVLDALGSDALIVKPAGFRTSVRRQSTHHVASSAEPQPRLMW